MPRLLPSTKGQQRDNSFYLSTFAKDTMSVNDDYIIAIL